MWPTGASPRTGTIARLVVRLAGPILLLATLLAASPVLAAPKISLIGPDSRAPITPVENGRFAFPNAQLRKNSVF